MVKMFDRRVEKVNCMFIDGWALSYTGGGGGGESGETLFLPYKTWPLISLPRIVQQQLV